MSGPRLVRGVRAWLAALAIGTMLAACGGGGGSDAPGTSPSPPSPPQISAQPQPQSVADGSAVSFGVTATGSGLAYQWQRNGSNVTGATGATLALPAVTLADSGALFRVTVTNAGGGVTSSEVALTVTPVAPTITTAPAAATVTAGQRASFGVTAAGSAPLAYQWLRDGSAIAGATAASYTTPATALGDDGALFAVSVTNGAGTITSNAARLTVQAAPPPLAITVQPQATSVRVGQGATFNVGATGAAPLAYQWRRDGSDIAGAVGASYTTPATTLADNGARFSVRVSDATTASVVSAEVTLGVGDTPPGAADLLVFGSTLSTPVGSNPVSTVTLLVADHDAPTPPALSRSASHSGLGDSYFRSLGLLTPIASQAWVPDASGLSGTLVGQPLVFFTENGQLFKVDVRRGSGAAPVRVSSVANACFVARVLPLDTSGLDAWVAVTTAGSDGDCSTSPDNRTVYARSGDTATTAPRQVALATFNSYLDTLGGADGRPLWMIGNTGGGARLFRVDDLSAGPAIGGLTTQQLFRLAQDPASAQAAYASTSLAANGQLRRLSWDAAGATLGATQHVFGATPGIGVHDANAAWIADGRRILRVSGTSAAVVHATLPGTADIDTLDQTDGHVIAMQGSTSGTQTVLSSLAKSGAQIVTLASVTRATTVLSLLGTRGVQVLYSTQPDATFLEATAEMRSVRGDGTGLATLAAGVGAVGVLHNRTIDRGRLTTDSLLWCTAVAPATDCRGGDLVEYELAAAAPRTLGRFDYGASSSSFSAFVVLGWTGLPVTLQINTARSSDFTIDLWVLKSGTAGSLKRVAGSGR